MGKTETGRDKKGQPVSRNALGGSRRDFLSRALVGTCSLAGLAGSFRLLVPNDNPGLLKRFAVGGRSDFGMNTLTWLPHRDLFVIHNQMGFGALSARCTHLGCVLRRTADGFACPCHGARFDANGQVISGPARRSLPWYNMWVAPTGQLWVAKDLEVESRPQPLLLKDSTLALEIEP
jgi:nitrite reductase/ring-hydroxylating ferredoxin subunit